MFAMPGSRARPQRSIPKGSVMLFYMASAPIGWTKITTQNDKAIRVVSGSGGVAGGTNSFSTVFAQTVVGNTSLSIAQLAAHTHTTSVATAGAAGGCGASTVTAGNTGSNGSGTAHNHSITMSIQFIDVIIASKN